ncbi:elongin BC and Polycomb repressive complex 2-associated protein [Pelodiscus sinensis]
MFLACKGTFGIVPGSMDYKGEFQTGYQEIEGINLGYLQVNGTQMFALAQVLSDLFKDIPRTTISKKMETLKIKSRRCDLRELRTLKAIRSVPTRAVKCSLISKADLEALCSSCKGLGPGRRKRKRREQLLLQGPGDLFGCPRQQLLAPCRAGPYCAQEPGIRAKLAPAPTGLLGEPFGPGFRNYDKATRGRKGHGLGGRGGLFAGVLSAYPPDLQLLNSAARAHGAGPASPPPQPGRCAKGLFPGQQGQGAARKGRLFPGSKRQGTSAGSSSDTDSSLDFGGSSPASSSDSSEEEDSSCSSEEGSSSESESSSLCSGDSVQSTRYRQAALPRFQQLPPPPHPPRDLGSEERLPEPPKAAPRPDPNLLLWARTLRASALESLRPLPAGEAGAREQEHASPKQGGLPAPASPSCSRPGGDPPPPPKQGSGGEAAELRQEASNDSGLGERAGPPGCAPPAAAQDSGGGPLSPAPQLPPGEPRREHFDRFIRQSKLWCYARGFSVDGKSLRPGGRPEPGKAPELQPPGPKRAPSPSKAVRGSGSDRNAKRRRLARGAEAERQQSASKGRPCKTPRGKAPKGKGSCRRPALPARNPFSLMGSFPCTPSLVVGADGDLCPAASLCVKNSGALSKTHPLWSWQMGGSALPVPPSLKFRGCGLEGF